MSREPTHPPQITCSQCAGRGEVALPRHLFEVLLAVRRLGHARASKVREAMVAKGWRLSATAYNNQLEQLRGLGLLERQSLNGRDVVYFLPRIVSRMGRK